MNNDILQLIDEKITELKQELVKRDEVVQEEVARREKELAEKDTAIRNEAERRERELAAKDEATKKELAAKDNAIRAEVERRERELAAKDEATKRELEAKDGEIAKLRLNVHRIDGWSSRYCTASFFLSFLLAVTMALIMQKHIELERALDDKANSTQLVLDLSTKVGKWGEEQLTELAELKKCQTDRNNQLVETIGLQDCKDMLADVKKRSAECADDLKNSQDKSESLLQSSQKLVVEKEKCSYWLVAAGDSLTMCETNLAACNEKKGG